MGADSSSLQNGRVATKRNMRIGLASMIIMMAGGIRSLLELDLSKWLRGYYIPSLGTEKSTATLAVQESNASKNGSAVQLIAVENFTVHPTNASSDREVEDDLPLSEVAKQDETALPLPPLVADNTSSFPGVVLLMSYPNRCVTNNRIPICYLLLLISPTVI